MYDLIKTVNNLEIFFMPPKRAMEEYRSNNIDILMFSDKGAYEIFNTTSKFLALFQGNTHLIYLKGSKNTGAISKDALTNKTVAVIRGVEEESKTLQLLGMTTLEVDSPEQSLKMVANGRIDYSNMSMLPSMYLLENLNIEESLAFSEKPTVLINVGFFYSKNPEEKITKVIEEIYAASQSDIYYSVIEGYITSSQKVTDYLPNR